MSKIFFRRFGTIFIAFFLTILYLYKDNAHDIKANLNISSLHVEKHADKLGNRLLKNRLQSIPSIENSKHSSQKGDLNLIPLLGPERKEVLDAIIEVSDPRLISQDHKIELINRIGHYGNRALDTLISEVISDSLSIDDSQKKVFLIDSLVMAAKSNWKAREYLKSYIQSMPKNIDSPRILHLNLVDRLEAFEKLSVYDEDAYKNILPQIESKNLRNKFISYYALSLARRGIDENDAREKIETIKSDFL